MSVQLYIVSYVCALSCVRSLAAAAPAVARWTNNGNNYQLR